MGDVDGNGAPVNLLSDAISDRTVGMAEGSGKAELGAAAGSLRQRPEDPAAFYNVHVFCCTNLREPGDPRGSCAEKGAVALRDYMKAKARRLGLPRIRINAAGCLDRCELGPAMVIYPEGIWYHYRSEADIDEILRSHLVEGKRAERLLLRPGDVVPPGG